MKRYSAGHGVFLVALMVVSAFAAPAFAGKALVINHAVFDIDEESMTLHGRNFESFGELEIWIGDLCLSCPPVQSCTPTSDSIECDLAETPPASLGGTWVVRVAACNAPHCKAEIHLAIPTGGPECVDGQMIECYSGDPGTLGVGMCAAGVRSCVDGAWGACEDEILPVPEADDCYDGEDNDCDGAADCDDDDCADAVGCDSCGLDPPPPGGVCPAVCSGGCTADNVCVIDCDTSDCIAAVITCPPGFACDVRCTGNAACGSATILCPATYSCHVACEGDWSCSSTTINCSSDGTCDLECGTTACPGTLLDCGYDACSASCEGMCLAEPMVDCGSSCECTGP
jgi:hypothetical protein